ncbi:MAG: NAD(P)/FAD-dependent oxidoreductase [Deltaproteobacteria bacterium]|nr:NAD(P)/FAD-dependent oxidoreductase [Deltaproteobacteria bacterium]
MNQSQPNIGRKTSEHGDARPRVVIIGGGFGGLNAAKALAKAPVDVCVIDRTNHHLFQPLLYQVATAGLSPGDIAYPIRSILASQPNVRVVMGDVKRIDRERRLAVLDGDVEPYDYLIVAAGTEANYFGHDDWAKRSPTLKDIHDALAMRRRLFAAYEAAERAKDPEKIDALLTFVIVGAGPTGVELAGSIREIAERVMRRDFRRIRPESTRVVLLDMAPRVLPAFPEKLSAKTEDALKRLGVEVRLGTKVEDITDEGVRTDRETIRAANVFWTAGVRASRLAENFGVELDRGGRVPVNEDLTIPGDPRVFVIGDMARFEYGGRLLPGMAPVAIQQGRHAAANAERAARGEPMRPFVFKDRGQMATIGRGRAVADIFGLRLAGRVAWFVWLFVHIWQLIGFRNKISVLTDWAYAYISFRRSARLIL